MIQIVQQSGALDYCRQRAVEETQNALNALQVLPETQARQALHHLAQLALDRIQ